MFYVDEKLFTSNPNKYQLVPAGIKHLKILDWEKLKSCTWINVAKKNGSWYCHLEGCQTPNAKYCDEDEFWIGFREYDNKIDCHFSSYGGMCNYMFEKFYDVKAIENIYDLWVQINTVNWLTKLIDEGVLGL